MRKVYIKHKKGEKPLLNITVRRVEASVWKSLGFYKHHYLTADMNKSCKCLLFEWGDVPIGFCAILNTPRKSVPYGCSISRVVVNPDFQGLGIGSIICNFVGGIVKSMGDGYRLYIKTAHEKIGEYFDRSPKWIGTSFDHKGRTIESTLSEGKRYRNRLLRKSYCKEYVGEVINGYEDILLPIKDMREKKRPKN